MKTLTDVILCLCRIILTFTVGKYVKYPYFDNDV
jgi:hypothetical protein